MSKYFLSVAAIFKNEALVLKEWMDHYIAEGVEHFYLVENNSTDHWESVLAPYREKGLVTLFIDHRQPIQTVAYEQHIQPLEETEWMIVVDLDEFVYARSGKISDFLEGLPPEVGNVQLPWVLFGSSGYEKQPDGVVRNFLWRKSYLSSSLELHKTIVRMRAVRRLGVHDHDFVPGTLVVNGGGVFVDMEARSLVDDEWLAKEIVVINHYRIQSREWFMRVKTNRGDSYYPGVWGGMDQKTPISEYYDLMEKTCGAVLDRTLADKRAREAVA